MENKSENEKRLSEIFRLAQELHKLLNVNQNDSNLGELDMVIGSRVLNYPDFQKFKAKPPVIENKDRA